MLYYAQGFCRSGRSSPLRAARALRGCASDGFAKMSVQAHIFAAWDTMRRAFAEAAEAHRCALPALCAAAQVTALQNACAGTRFCCMAEYAREFLCRGFPAAWRHRRGFCCVCFLRRGVKCRFCRIFTCGAIKAALCRRSTAHRIGTPCTDKARLLTAF